MPRRLPSLDRPAASPRLWSLEPATTFLNHGAFGACPREVLARQRELRDQMERQPVRFFTREMEPLLDESRRALGRFLGAAPEDLVPVPNATFGVNCVLRSLEFEPGDEIIVTDHEYNASRNAAVYAAMRAKATVIVAHPPFPLRSGDEIIDAILRCVTPKTRLAMIDHVTSQTGLVFPIERIARELEARGVDLLVDGAHAPGMVPLNLKKLGAAYYTGNCHKWVCAPKGAAFLYVRRDLQKLIRPLSISHGANSPRQDRSRFLIEFGWTGTCDPTPFLTLPKAIDFIGSLLPGGWAEVRERNHALALAAQKHLSELLGIALPCPPALIGSLASIPLPDAAPGVKIHPKLLIDPLQDKLLHRHQIEVPIIPWPAWPKRLIRVSAQLYNHLPHYAKLAQALGEELASGGKGSKQKG